MSNEDDNDWFRNALGDVKPIAPVDKVDLARERRNTPNVAKRKAAAQSELDSQANADFAFSDAFQAHFAEDGPLRYARSSQENVEFKRLRRGDYTPELILDLHGLNRDAAKQEIAALLFHAKRHHHQCVCIVHGIGSGILKQQVPNWLIQHPDVIAFHQAPLEWGGNGALLVLLTHADPKLSP